MAKQLKPCGTFAAYRRHLRNNEPACPECLSAERNRQRLRTGGGPRPAPQPCGTIAAYNRHLRAKEKACKACLAAWARYNVARRLARKAVA